MQFLGNRRMVDETQIFIQTEATNEFITFLSLHY